MFFIPDQLNVNHNASVVEKTCEFRWAAKHEEFDQYQTAYAISLSNGWQTGWIQSQRQFAPYDGPPLASGQQYTWTLQLRDKQGRESITATSEFYTALQYDWTAPWIAPSLDSQQVGVYFRKEFMAVDCLSATLFVCGLGYQVVSVNGKRVEDAVLQPAHTDYSKRCMYTTIPITTAMREGANVIGIVLGEGWRRNEGPYLGAMGERRPRFFGTPQLTCALLLRFADREEWLYTDDSWSWSHGPVVENNLFDGERYDARLEMLNWDCAGFDASGWQSVQQVPSPGGMMCAQTLQPIREQQEYEPVSLSMPQSGMWIFDFGQNLAGVVRLKLPAGLPTGIEIRIEHAEVLQEDGTLYRAPLRGAQAADTYITAGMGEVSWQPQFNYHGFRYAALIGYPGLPSRDTLTAVAMYTDVDNHSRFSSGSALLNQIHKNVVQTERANLHSIATDCPQRDERMGWMNDATVRFEEIPYNFDVGQMFPKIVRDLMDAQAEDGGITCTAPFVYGGQPADPVSSSFLVAGWQALLYNGDEALIKEAYPAFKAWNACLAAHAPDGLVDYSYYGDWAGPEDYCTEDGVHSRVTPGVLMSTGYHFFNYVLLAKFARVLGLEAEAATHDQAAERVRQAFLNKWVDADSGKVATGSEGCQAFALWLGILPVAGRELAAARLHDAVAESGWRLTTGNLTSRYLIEMLADYGYIDDAWRILMREIYPSWGFMIQHGATTVWERLELKKDPGMNSHNHPMFGAVGASLYSRIAGITPLADGLELIKIAPRMPSDLLSAEGLIDTWRGDIGCRWIKQYGQTHVYVTVPFGVRAQIELSGINETVGSGYWHYSWNN